MSRKFSKVFRGLKFPLGSEPTDCEPGDMFYDSVSGKFKAKESGDSVAKPVISSGGAAPITAASFGALPDPTSLPLGTLGSVSSSVSQFEQVSSCGPTGNIYSMAPAADAPFYAKLDSEIVLVTGWTRGMGFNEWALQRGQLGTTAAGHANAAIYRVTKLIYTVTNALGAIHWA